MRNNENAMALQLYKGQYFTFVNGNAYEADKITDAVEYYMKPGDNVVQVDTENGLPSPPPAPAETGQPAASSFTESGEVWTYPIAAAPVNLYLPAVAEAAGKFYNIVLQCGGELCTVYDVETKTQIFQSAVTGESILLYCNGYGWYDVTVAQLIP